MAVQSKMQLLDLNQELIIKILSNTTLLHQCVLRRASKNFRQIIEERVWFHCKSMTMKQFDGDQNLPLDQLCSVMLPKMPNLKYFPILSYLCFRTSYLDYIVDLLCQHCHGIVSFCESFSTNYYLIYLLKLQEQSIPISDRKIEVLACEDNLSKLQELPLGVPIKVSACELSKIDLSINFWLADKITNVDYVDFDSAINTPNVIKITSLKLNESIMKYRHQLQSLIILEIDSFDNLKYFNNLSSLDINVNIDNENLVHDLISLFQSDNMSKLTELSLSFRLIDKDDFLSQFVELKRKTKWRILELCYFYQSTKFYCHFRYGQLYILGIGALNWVSKAEMLTGICHRLEKIIIFDAKKETFIENFKQMYLYTYASVHDYQLQSWKSMMTNLAADKKNVKFYLDLIVEDASPDKIEGDNWTICQKDNILYLSLPYHAR